MNTPDLIYYMNHFYIVHHVYSSYCERVEQSIFEYLEKHHFCFNLLIFPSFPAQSQYSSISLWTLIHVSTSTVTAPWQMVMQSLTLFYSESLQF